MSTRVNDKIFVFQNEIKQNVPGVNIFLSSGIHSICKNHCNFCCGKGTIDLIDASTMNLLKLPNFYRFIEKTKECARQHGVSGIDVIFSATNMDPFQQKNFDELSEKLMNEGFYVGVRTNGQHFNEINSDSKYFKQDEW